jgi:hypothetical protein
MHDRLAEQRRVKTQEHCVVEEEGEAHLQQQVLAGVALWEQTN